MANPIGAIGSNDERLASLKKKFYNPAEKSGGKSAGCFVATLDDFTKTGNVSGYSDVSIHTQSA